MSRPADVLVVGAGPTGLTLALQAHAFGASVRIVDRRTDPVRPSRALILHPRTLEVLRPLGVTESVLTSADRAPEAHLHLGRRVVRARLADLALQDTAFPILALVRQMDVEAALAHAVAHRGIAVEWGTTATAVHDTGDAAQATFRSAAGSEQVACDYIAGCDGPESTVRRAARIGWEGDAYDIEVILADLHLTGDLAPGVAHVVADRRGLLFLFNLGERAPWRLLATRPAGIDPLPYGQPGAPVPIDELQALLDDARLDARIDDLAWSATYRLQHRLAPRFRSGRLFLAGDAAHAFSPALGQGMNMGIQDAANLGWKLAFAPTATDRAGLLDSYEQERRPAIRQVLRLTHLAFWGEASTDPLPALLRGVIAPIGAPLAPVLLRQRWLIAAVVRLISHLRLAYPDSPLSTEGQPPLADWVGVGQRLPDLPVIASGQPIRLHTLLARPGVHILRQRDAMPLDPYEFGRNVYVHHLTSIPGTGILAVRPDGYVGFRCGTSDHEQLGAWLRHIGAVMRLRPPA